MHRYRAAVLAFLLAVVPSSLSAQVQLAVSGFGGVFLPASDLTGGTFFFEPGEVTGFAGEVATTWRYKAAFNTGGRVTVWPTQRIGFEAEVAYVLNNLDLDVLVPFVQDPGPPVVLGLGEETVEFDSNVVMGSVNFVYALIRPPLEPLVVFVSAGVGFVSRLEDASDIFDSSNRVTGVWGFGLKYGVARGLWLRADVRDYVSSFGDEDQGLDDKIQNDFLVNAGLEFSFGG